jgi:hypothetical protein
MVIIAWTSVRKRILVTRRSPSVCFFVHRPEVGRTSLTHRDKFHARVAITV